MKPSTFQRWIGPMCILALGAGSLAGAIQYRVTTADAPAVVVAPTKVEATTETVSATADRETVTKTVEAPPRTLTVRVSEPPRVETRVLPPRTAVETRTVTVTAPGRVKPRETVTETVVQVRKNVEETG